MNIKGLDKAKVLLALYNGSHQQGFSFLGFPGREPTIEDCQEHLNQSTYVDYFFGRIIKCELGGDNVSLNLYDRDCGQGAGERVLVAQFPELK